MNHFFATWLIRPFWASPYSSVYDLILESTDFVSSRQAQALAPGVPREDPAEEPPIRPARPAPADVPVPNPRDAPAREPKDVPPPNPGKPIKPVPRNPDPKPRPTP